ncbi:proline-rich protein 18 [Myxocyprinus asiaticus]|uniref:proline-rich protein 18 n=1 Tax=Myxocyprinus asiaticus TaxID=70543 RepID=UPI0022238FF6|nr:proline-rich protein 18 [Myxocyprinus asiaticus]
MPFPPVTRPRSLPSSGKEKLSGPSPVLPVKTLEEKNSVKEQLKKLSKKTTQHKSKLPTSRSSAGLRLDGKSARIMTPRHSDPASPSTPSSSKSCSGIGLFASNSFATNSKDASVTNASEISSSKRMSRASMSATNISMNISTDSSSPRIISGCSGSGLEEKINEAMKFSLNLTPEAKLLLQKRSREKQLNATRSGTCTGRTLHHKDLSGKSSYRSNIPLVKISLLNDRHRYDDVEYEDDEEGVVDQSVLLKCSEWLRGVENAAGATTLGRVDKISQKSI